MATVIADIIEGARWKEVNGTVTEITRIYDVRDLPAPPPPSTPGVAFAVQLGFDELHQIALNVPSVPQPGEAHPVKSALVVTSRIPRARSPFAVRILVHYSLPGGSGFDPPPGSSFVLSGGSSVEQIETQLYRLAQPDGTPAGNQITVEHNGVTQGVEISPFEARDVLRVGNVFQSADPQALSRSWTNLVNSGTFLWDGSAIPRTWLVTEYPFTLTNSDTLPFPTYEFTVSLRHNAPILPWKTLLMGWPTRSC